MLPFDIIYTDSYQRDYSEIMHFLARNWHSNSIDNFELELNEKFNKLEDAPELYAKYYLNEKYRSFTVWNYKVFYEVDNTAGEILVARIIHSSRNIADLL